MTIPNGVDVTGDTDSLGYKISDGNATENADDFNAAIEIIAEWYEDLDSWANGNGDTDKHEAIREAIDSVDRPEQGGLENLENYAGSICTAIAEKLGGKAFYGHGNYAVSAASQMAINLTVTEIEKAISEITKGQVDLCQGQDDKDRAFGYVAGDEGGYFFTWMPTLEATLESIEEDEQDGDGDLDESEVRDFLESYLPTTKRGIRLWGEVE